ncbi:hypothetical protein GQ457_02G021020 [Hibiscus cannabinus]
MDASSGNDDNGPNGVDASASNGPDNVHFGWNNDMVDEESYEAQEDSGESDWLENENGDRDEEADNEANTTDENAVNEEATDGIGDNEADGADESETEGNEASLVGLSTSEETDYLGSSDVGSYEIDSYGYFVSRKTTKLFFDSSTSEPRFGLGCPFVVHASWDKFDCCFKVKTLITDHNCSVTLKNKRANYKFVGKHFISKIRIVPKLRLADMMRLGREELNLELNKQLCSRANKWAEEKKKGNITHEFNRLFDYVLALRTADPNGSFDLVVQRPTDLRGTVDLLLGVNGCFLNGYLKGEILSAVGRNSNNQIFPIAWAYVEGLLEEVSLCLPHVDKRYCARHMYVNWKKDHKGGDL